MTVNIASIIHFYIMWILLTLCRLQCIFCQISSKQHEQTHIYHDYDIRCHSGDLSFNPDVLFIRASNVGCTGP